MNESESRPPADSDGAVRSCAVDSPTVCFWIGRRSRRGVRGLGRWSAVALTRRPVADCANRPVRSERATSAAVTSRRETCDCAPPARDARASTLSATQPLELLDHLVEAQPWMNCIT